MPALRRLISVYVIASVIVLPVVLHADGITLVADLEYSTSNDSSTAKETGIVSDSDSSRFNQLYQLDLSRFVYPNLLVNIGGYFENQNIETSLITGDEPEVSSDVSERTLRPYAEVNLINRLYKAGLAYRTRDTENSGSGTTRSTMVEEYNAVLNWRPVELPRLNINFQRLLLTDEPLTVDTTRDLLNISSKYSYGNYVFDYTFVSQENVDNLQGSGSVNNNHLGSVAYTKGFDYRENRFDLRASAKVTYNTIEFSGREEEESAVDVPAVNAGNPFYIRNDTAPASNDPQEVSLVDSGNRLTDINIGRNGGLTPVSIGLSFGVPTEVETIYIQLSEDDARFPDLATTSQVSAVADSYLWQFFSSDDQLELSWREHPVVSVTFNSVDNRFELRLAEPITTRRVKVTTTPLTVVAPGEIRYRTVRALTTVSALSEQEPENLNQYYTFALQWSPSGRTSIGYENYYRKVEAKHVGSERVSWANTLFFRHTLNPIFLTYGRLNSNERTRTTQEGEVEESDLLYNLGLKANYLETLSQSLVFTGSDRSDPEGSSSTNSIVLRTDADLYEGWIMNLDLGYSFNTLVDGREQTSKVVRLGTNIEPNRRLNFTLDYSLNLTEETDRADNTTQFGTFQALWTLTDTMNMFFRYNFRVQEGDRKTSSYLREINLNWAPFSGGTLQFAVNYNESTDVGNREFRAVSPTLSWRVARGIFFDLKYTIGTVDTAVESRDFETYIAKIRIFY